jgi:hypothetical protein
MRYLTIIFLILSFTFLGCKKSSNIDEFIFKTWQLDWKQCGIYQNKYDAKINFTKTDSTDFGWFLEQGSDSVKFSLSIVNNNKILLSEASDSTWEGVLNLKKLDKGVLVFEREIQECIDELYHFE